MALPMEIAMKEQNLIIFHDNVNIRDISLTEDGDHQACAWSQCDVVVDNVYSSALFGAWLWRQGLVSGETEGLSLQFSIHTVVRKTSIPRTNCVSKQAFGRAQQGTCGTHLECCHVTFMDVVSVVKL